MTTDTKRLIQIQPEPVIDNMWVDKHANPGQSPIILGERQPYPFTVTEDGSVEDQDFWRGDPARVVGFQRDEEVQRVDLWWADAVADPELVVGMFPVMVGPHGLYTYTVAIESIRIIEVPA